MFDSRWNSRLPRVVPDVDLALHVRADDLRERRRGPCPRRRPTPGSRRRRCPTRRPTGRRARRCAAAACRRAPASRAARSRPGGRRGRTRRCRPPPARCGCRRRGRRGSATTRRHRARRRGRCGKPGQHVLVAVQVHVAPVLALEVDAALVELRHDLHGEAVGLGVRAPVRGLRRRSRARGRRSCPRWRGTATCSSCTSTSASTPSKALVWTSPLHHADGTRLKSPGVEAVSGSLFGCEPGAT